MKFIITQNKESAQRLKDLGLELFSVKNDTYTFVNKPQNDYSLNKISGLVFTNKVTL